MKPFWHKTHNQIDLLNDGNPVYCDWIDWCLAWQFENDVGEGDITSNILFQNPRKGSAKIIAKAKGVLAGGLEIKYFLKYGAGKPPKKIGKISIDFLKNDGQLIKTGDVICKIKGDVKDILKVERTLLNTLSRLSGIATKTRLIVNKVKKINPRILVTLTRKTLWGLLEKRACALGGGGTHRLGLYDAILIKDNHLLAKKTKIPEMIEQAAMAKRQKAKFFEIEVEKPIEALRAAKKFKELIQKKLIEIPCFIMLDNMRFKTIKKTIGLFAKNGLRKFVGLEASGGITQENIVDYAKTGIDIISMGALANNVPSLDFSLEF